jgi:hypothetical protein
MAATITLSLRFSDGSAVEDTLALCDGIAGNVEDFAQEV